MVDLSKPNLLRMTPQRSQHEAPVEYAVAPASMPISSLPDIQEAIMEPSRLLGRVDRLPVPEGCILEQAHMICSGSTIEMPPGAAFVIFQQGRGAIIPRAFLSQGKVRINGPAAYMPIQEVDVTAHHLDLIASDDGLGKENFSGQVFAGIVVSGIYAGLAMTIDELIGTGFIGVLLQLQLAALNGYLLARFGLGVWNKRGKLAKKRISDNMDEEVALFLPEVLSSHAKSCG